MRFKDVCDFECGMGKRRMARNGNPGIRAMGIQSCIAILKQGAIRPSTLKKMPLLSGEVRPDVKFAYRR